VEILLYKENEEGTMRRRISVLGILVSLACVIGISGCSDQPSRGQLNQLQELQAEVAALTRKVNALDQEKAALLASVEAAEVKLTAARAEENMIEEKLRNGQ
jgi:septal ring factor EnvC (AmiA/AmiB activator)